MIRSEQVAPDERNSGRDVTLPSATKTYVASVCCALTLSCGSSTKGAVVGKASSTRPDAVATSSELPLLAPSRRELSAPTPTPLEITSILPVWGDDTALFVSEFAGDRVAYFQRVDGERASLGPIVGLSNENPFGAFAHGSDLTVASTHDGAICITTYRGAEIVKRHCEVLSGTLLLPLGKGFVVLSVSPPDPDAKTKKLGEASKEKKPQPAPEKTRPKDAKAKSPRPKPTKRHAGAHPEAKVMADPHKLSLDRQLLTDEGALDGENEPTGLVFTAPLAGMDLVAGTSSGTRVRALYYEWAGSVKNAKTGVLGRAELSLGSLDDSGTYDETSRSQLSETDLMFGYLAEHQEPRLMTTSHGALYLGLMSAHGKCEVRVVSPFSMPLIPDDSLCEIDPRGYFDVAESVRAAQKAGGSIGRIGFPTPPTISPLLQKARRAYAQPDYDPERGASWGDRAYAVSGDDAVTWKTSDAATVLPRPLVAHRSRIISASFAPDGSGVAELERTMARVDEMGELIVDQVATDSSSHLSRHDVADVARRSFAKVGSTFWESRGELRPAGQRHGTGKALRPLPNDSAVLVGGPEKGFVLEVSGGYLSVARFDPTARTVTPIGGKKAPVGIGFDAVERHSGGAIVAGVTGGVSPRVVAFTLDADGSLGPVADTGLSFDPKEPAVRLIALPLGGALLTDFARREVVWLDESAHPVGKAKWLTAVSDASCVDGWPAPEAVPSPEPGKLVSIPGFGGPGTCVTGEIAWAADGSFRWFGSTASGPHTRAEVGRVEIAKGTPMVSPVPSFTPLDAPAASRCPSDMVEVQSRMCVDRFEATLADRDSGDLLSPDVATTMNLESVAMAEWSTRRERVGDLFARALPLPFVSPMQLGRNIDTVAVNRMGIRPSGYVTGVVAKSACEAAGKRLCSLDEWKTACRSETDTLFPYGSDYEDGVCNVNRQAHPAALLHGHSSLGHLDPRLNYASANGSPLFHRTGQSPRCASRWGDDAIYDMVGNLDEWVDDGAGAFAGGFYSRGTKSGCGALVDNHPASYLDYSTGIRCCKDAAL